MGRWRLAEVTIQMKAYKVILSIISIFLLFGLTYASTSNFKNVNLNGHNLSGVGTIFGNSTSVRIGDAASNSHSLTSEDDLFVSGNLEVDETVYVDDKVYIDNKLIMTVSGITYGLWKGSQDDGLIMVSRDGDGRANRNTIITDYSNAERDHDHDVQSNNPTFFIHSVTDPDVNNTQWGSLSHDTESVVIDSGTDNIILDDTTRVSGDIESGDTVGQDAFQLQYNGSHVVFDSVLDDDFIFVGGNITFPGGGKIGNYNSTCLGLWSPAGTGVTTVCD